MGVCLSRTSDSNALEHDEHNDHTNDHRFTALTDQFSISKVSIDKANLVNQLKQLRLRKSLIKAKLVKCDSSLVETSCLTLEIRKGKAIEPSDSWFDTAKISVRGILTPDGPSFETDQSELGLLKWYRLFEIKQNLRAYTSLEMLVIANYGNKAVPYGTCRFSLAEAASQECFLGWLPIRTFNASRESAVKAQPFLEVRLQYLHDEMEVVRRYNLLLQSMIIETVKLIEQHSKAELV